MTSITMEVNNHIFIHNMWIPKMDSYIVYPTSWINTVNGNGTTVHYLTHDNDGGIISVKSNPVDKETIVNPSPQESLTLDNSQEIQISNLEKIASLQNSITENNQTISELRWDIELHDKSIDTYYSLIYSVRAKYDGAIASQIKAKDIAIEHPNASEASVWLNTSTSAIDISNKIESYTKGIIDRLISERDYQISVYYEKINSCNAKISEIEDLIVQLEWFIETIIEMIEYTKSSQ